PDRLTSPGNAGVSHTHSRRPRWPYRTHPGSPVHRVLVHPVEAGAQESQVVHRDLHVAAGQCAFELEDSSGKAGVLQHVVVEPNGVLDGSIFVENETSVSSCAITRTA